MRQQGQKICWLWCEAFSRGRIYLPIAICAAVDVLCLMLHSTHPGNHAHALNEKWTPVKVAIHRLNLSGNLSGLARWSHFFYSLFFKNEIPASKRTLMFVLETADLITCSICLKQRYIANRASHLGRTRHWRPPSTQSFLCERGTQNNTNSEPASKHIYLQHIYFPSTDCNSYTFGSGK